MVQYAFSQAEIQCDPETSCIVLENSSNIDCIHYHFLPGSTREDRWTCKLLPRSQGTLKNKTWCSSSILQGKPGDMFDFQVSYQLVLLCWFYIIVCTICYVFFHKLYSLFLLSGRRSKVLEHYAAATRTSGTAGTLEMNQEDDCSRQSSHLYTFLKEWKLFGFRVLKATEDIQ